MACLLAGCDNSPHLAPKPSPSPSPIGDMGCTPGTLGCACDDAGGCAGDAFCNHERVCAQPTDGCTPGDVECSCAGGGCNAGLACLSGVCRDNSGQPGGPCLANSHCHTAARCAGDVCVACSPGEQGCTCNAGGTCNETLACADGMCTASAGYAAAPAAATVAVCATPCSGGMVAPDGTYVACPADGVMDGCLPGQACSHGQCLCSGSQPATCTADVDCPDFQACLDGYCRANCNADGDCRAGAICRRRVCRKSCDIGTPACPSGQICQPLDGQKGACVMKGDALLTPSPRAAALAISTAALRFSPSGVSNTVTITNTSSFDSSVVLRKWEESEPGQPPKLIQLADRELAATVDSKVCTTGTRGCRCSTNAANPCVAPAPGFSLTCDAGLCQLPTCVGGSEGCACNGADCRLLCQPGRCPLNWVTFDVTVDGTSVKSGVKDTVTSFVLPAGKAAKVVVGSTAQAGPWQGVVEVEPAGGGATRQQIALSYANTPDGSWGGSIYYFGDFLVSSTGLSAWQMALATAGNDAAGDTLVKNLGNAFLQEWANFRRGKISYKTFSEVLTSTRTGSWKSPVLSARCNGGTVGSAVCFPDDSTLGFQLYTQSPTDSPVPGGVVELPFGMTLQAVNKTLYQGVVDSTQALQYPGSPAVALGFGGDPGACVPGSDGNCVSFVQKFHMDSVVGGHYNAAPGAYCQAPYNLVSEPWLVPGFAGRSVADSSGNWLYECRDTLGAANPMLDGRPRSRHFTLIDGALINGDTMLILFNESTDALAVNDANSAVSAYGILVLRRKNSNATMTPATAPSTGTPPAGVAPDVSCKSATAALDPIAARLGQGNTATLLASARAAQGQASTLWPQIVRGLMTGSTVDEFANPPPTMNAVNGWELNTAPPEQVHFLCDDTRLFDGSGQECPVGSRVTYFTVNANVLGNADVEGHSCQADATCDATLKSWIAQGGRVLQGNPSWKCADGSATCNGDTFELRKGKSFYPLASNSVYLPIATAVDEAFRYRTRFVNRAGTNLGFAPEICDDGDKSILYCYSPKDITVIEQRYNCLTDIYLNTAAEIDIKADTTTDANHNTLQTQLVNALHTAFSDGAPPQLGFERLRAELLVMLGDDAYVRALSSRFDLAGLGNAHFPGSRLETGGIDLSGVAGAEMFSLYQASQYYQLAIDRLSALIGPMWQIVGRKENIITQDAAVGSISRVIRASSQKAEVASEIAKHYQNFDRADLARQVIARGYVAAYLESMELTTLIKAIGTGAAVAQIQATIDDAQLTYHAALQEMTQRYASIGQDVNYFGLPADYIPFPALEGAPPNTTAFDVEIQRANQIASIAAQAEVNALQSTRSFDSDAVAFQNQLASIVNTYESQLADICGTFSAGGVVYPAIAKYAALDPVAATWGDPCGRMGTGQLNDAMLQIAVQQKTLQGDVVSMDNVLRQVEIERERISAACQTNADWEAAQIDLQGRELRIQDTINAFTSARNLVEGAYNLAFNLAFVASPGTPLSAALDTGLGIAGATALAVETVLDVGNDVLQHDLQDLQDQQANLQFMFQCNDNGTGLLQIDSAATVKNLLLQMGALQVQGARDRYALQQAASQAQQLANQASRTQAQLDQNVQMAINAAAAANNPNIRIYANDAVINADNSFNSALTEAYRATRVFEYYTGQTYAGRDQLYLVRMVTSGDINLQQYLVNLEAAFRLFQDDAGIPDMRVSVLSLRDDLLRIPMTNECGEPLSTNQRVTLMQRQLSAPGAFDANGYIVVPFRIGPELLSPLTVNHKLQFAEAQIIGGRGDQIGRVYLRMSGASMVATSPTDLTFYSFPRRTGVINVFFSVKPPEIDPSVYRTYHFQDRPLMNSNWELVLNFKDEPANADFTIDDVSDVRIYLYYSDFTQF